jgi:hypothetical protein
MPSIFDNLPEKEDTKPVKKLVTEAEIEGFFWPLDRWFIERILIIVSGGITIFSCFLAIVFTNLFLLLPAMFWASGQIIFAMTGFSITVKALQAMGVRQNSIQ